VAQVGIRELLESGVHFGHQTRRWNPKMRRFIFGERAGIYIIDLLKTEQLLRQAEAFASEIAQRGGTILFVGTKKQARDAVKSTAEAAGMPYVNHRWLGGLLTNFQTISLRIKRLHDLERYEAEGQLQLLPTRERLNAEADLVKLRANLGGVKNMQRPPDAMFVIDLKTEAIAVKEAQRLRIPIIGLVDTNCDPDGIDYIIPGNDDAMRSCDLVARAIGDVIQQGRSAWTAAEDARRMRETEEQARRQAEEQARRDAEEAAKREAEEAAQALAHGGTGEPRDVAEATVAEAVEKLGRPQAEGRRQKEAAAAAVAADEPAMPAVSATGPGAREERVNPNVGDRDPQAAGARAAEGAPASDTAAGAPGEPAAATEEQPAAKARTRAKKAKDAGDDAPVAAEPGPTATAAEALEAAPPAAEAAPSEAAAEATDAPAEAPSDAAPDTDEGDGGVVDTARDAAATAAETVENVAEAAADVAPGPLKGVAKVAARAAGAAADALSTDDENKDAEEKK
jgi:small subunit ribosomal protein S2